jgi:hypothetical protein
MGKEVRQRSKYLSQLVVRGKALFCLSLQNKTINYEKVTFYLVGNKIYTHKK